jgi:arylformamidase
MSLKYTTPYDISPTLSDKTAVFPGDVAFSREVSLSFKNKDSLELSSITTTLHLGAHTDAPCHYAASGSAMNERPLDYYIGPAQVVEAKVPRGVRLTKEHVDFSSISAPRVLFKTGSFPDPDRWNEDFNSFAPELLSALADRGVILVGIDTPSVDPWDSKKLESHQILMARDMAVLEGIVLQDVPAGFYHLVALPLKIKGADASPVRAVLYTDQDWARL